MKTIIAGGRDFNPVSDSWIKALNVPWEITEVVSGGAKGADRLGERWAYIQGLPVKIFEANWDVHSKAAGPIRNTAMAKYADACICFWDGRSKGTKNMIDNAIKYGLYLKVVYY